MVIKRERDVAAAAAAFGVSVVLVERGTVPKTSSGKIQRRLTRRRYVDGDLTPGRAPFITLARVAVYGIIERFRMRIRELRRSA